MSGLKIAAIYGLRPHQLGLCGPKEAAHQQTLRKFIFGKIPVPEAKKILQQFKGAYPYYRLIAESNNIKNPLKERVVNAYWIGNELLDKVKIKDLRKMIADEFSKPGLLPKDIAFTKAALIPTDSKPHHSFHVLVIGSVTGTVDFKNTKLKDLCRVGWGKVIKISNFPRPRQAKRGGQFPISKIVVNYQPLVRNKKIRLGNPVKKEITWDREIAPKLKIGDWVSFHWSWLVKVLNADELINLRKYTQNTLNTLK